MLQIHMARMQGREEKKKSCFDREIQFKWNFDRTIISLILLNCLLLMLTSPYPTCFRAGMKLKGDLNML